MSNNPVVRVKGFQKAAPPVDAPAIPEVKAEEPTAPRFKARAADPPVPVEDPPVESSQTDTADVSEPTERPLTIGAHDAILPHYTKDADQERIIRRKWWKHNLYVKSGRQKDDAPQQKV